MSQPDDFGFGEDAALLKASARRLLAERLPAAQLHALVAGNPAPDRGPACQWPEALWQELVALGWHAVAVPERAGGAGLPWVAVAGLLEEAGRVALPSPLLATLCSTAVLAACGEAADAALAEVAAGRTVTLALMDALGRPGAAAVRAGDRGLEGDAYFVQDLGKCERLLVLAAEGDDSGWYWMDRAAAGVTMQADAIVDLTRDQARVQFSQAPAERLCGSGGSLLEAALPVIWVLWAADMVGAAEWQLQTTVDYARQRQQFDRPLGFFQAVKHDLVNVMLAIDESRSLLYSAACALDHEPSRLRRLAHMAKASASDTAAFASGRSIQLHGGIGFTWEAHLHLYFKRQKHSQLLWGDGRWHRARLAELVIDAAS